MTTDDCARLKAEAQDLNGQVRLLVLTEQRLFRSQRELAAQLSRMRALAELSLVTSPGDSAEVIIRRGLHLLRSMFDVDCVIAISQQEPSSAYLVWDSADRIHEAPPRQDLSSWLSAGTRAEVVPLLRWDEEAVPSALVALSSGFGMSGTPNRATSLVGLSMASAGVPYCAGIFAWKAAGSRPAPMAELPAPTHQPFLQLFAEHLKRSLENAALTRKVAERGEELALANLRLSESLSSLRETQEQLIHAQKMEAIGRLAGGVAHDFNNLLCATLGCCDFIMTRLDPSDPIAKEIHLIRASSERAATLTAQLLAFSRRQPFRPKLIRLPDMVAEIQTLMRPLLGDRVKLHVVPSPDTGLIRADPGQVQQVLMNLVVNARDAMPEGGTLTIETANVSLEDPRPGHSHVPAPGSYVVISVRDTGCGMDDATLARLFEPYFTTKAKGKGTGLGLATVHGVVAQSGGHIRVQSEIGRGSAFHVYFPRVDPNAAVQGELNST